MKTGVILVLALALGGGVGWLLGRGAGPGTAVRPSTTGASNVERISLGQVTLLSPTDMKLTERSPRIVFEGERSRLTLSSAPLVTLKDPAVGEWVVANAPTAIVSYSEVVGETAVTYYLPGDDFPGELTSTHTIFNLGGERYDLETAGLHLRTHFSFLGGIERRSAPAETPTVQNANAAAFSAVTLDNNGCYRIDLRDVPPSEHDPAKRVYTWVVEHPADATCVRQFNPTIAEPVKESRSEKIRGTNSWRLEFFY